MVLDLKQKMLLIIKVQVINMSQYEDSKCKIKFTPLVR